MYKNLLTVIIIAVEVRFSLTGRRDNPDRIDIIDMTKPTTWNSMSPYYGAMEKHW